MDPDPAPDPDPAIFVNDLEDANKNNFFSKLSAYYFLKVLPTFKSIFKDKKS